MQETMSAHADQLGAVPAEEVDGRLSNMYRILQQFEADRAAAPLVPEYPAQGKKRYGKASNQLQVFGIYR